jgi:hypothetical protein
MKTITTKAKSKSSNGFVIFKSILENKKKIEQALKQGKSLTELKDIKIAKPLSLIK